MNCPNTTQMLTKAECKYELVSSGFQAREAAD